MTINTYYYVSYCHPINRACQWTNFFSAVQVLIKPKLLFLISFISRVRKCIKLTKLCVSRYLSTSKKLFFIVSLKNVTVKSHNNWKLELSFSNSSLSTHRHCKVSDMNTLVKVNNWFIQSYEVPFIGDHYISTF